MLLIQIAIVLALLVASGLRTRGPNPREWLHDAPLVFIAALITQASCLHLYGFTRYAPGWIGWIAGVPLMVPLIWTLVVLSARDVARLLAPARLIPLTFLVVWYDALLIEPVATHAGLWLWRFPAPKQGPFFVPHIALLGYAFFALAAVACLDRLKGRWRLATMLLAPLITHALLLAGWWGALRWIGGAPTELVWTIVLVAVAVALTAWLLVTKRLGTIPLKVLAPRLVPAACVFLLLFDSRREPLLWIYAGSFALPWLAALDWRGRARRAGAGS